MEKSDSIFQTSPFLLVVGNATYVFKHTLGTLANAGVLAENKLFATLDPTTRKFTLP